MSHRPSSRSSSNGRSVPRQRLHTGVTLRRNVKSDMHGSCHGQQQAQIRSEEACRRKRRWDSSFCKITAVQAEHQLASTLRCGDGKLGLKANQQAAAALQFPGSQLALRPGWKSRSTRWFPSPLKSPSPFTLASVARVHPRFAGPKHCRASR